MAQLPDNPNFDHLRKQAKDLLRLYQDRDPAALARFRQSLPAAAGLDDTAIAALDLKLHDAQSAVAREYGAPSWNRLRESVDERKSDTLQALQDALPVWLYRIYGHDNERPRPVLAARMLAQLPELARGGLFRACAGGDEAVVRQALAADAASVHRPGPAWQCPGCKRSIEMPPLVAVSHSSLVRLPEFRDRLHRCARVLLDAGADPNQSYREGEHPLSALYGAAGKNHDPVLTRMLLDAGANPNDGESLYHSMETRDLTCARMLLEAGARVEGTNALHRQLDGDHLEGLLLLLSYTKDPNDSSSGLGSPLLWALRRGRSRAHVEALLKAGADPLVRNKGGITAGRLAAKWGTAGVAELFGQAGVSEPLSVEERFVAACARGDESEARAIVSSHHGVLGALTEAQLHLLPNLTEAGNTDAVKLLVRLGWPIATRGGDWGASALNLAVFRGDSELTRFLLDHGASWTETHGYGDNVNGTLSWASRNRDPQEGDWVGCAKALVAHGMPVPEASSAYSDPVEEFFAEARANAGMPRGG